MTTVIKNLLARKQKLLDRLRCILSLTHSNQRPPSQSIIARQSSELRLPMTRTFFAGAPDLVALDRGEVAVLPGHYCCG